MRQFTYTVYLPGQKKTVQIKELQFSRYKHFVKNITNDNNEIIATFLDDLLIDLCPEEQNICSFSFLDKLIVLLTIRSLCLSPVLELTTNCPITKKQFNTTIQLSTVINKLQNLNIPDSVYSTIKKYNNLDIELGMPNSLYIKEKDLTTINTVIKKITLNNSDIKNITDQVIDHIPVIVLRDIKEYFIHFSNYIKNINIISIQSPFVITEFVEIPLNLFSNSIIEFIKICFKRSLISFYELEYFLNNKLNLDFELIKTSTPAELDIYVNFYKDEREKEESAERKKSLNLP